MRARVFSVLLLLAVGCGEGDVLEGPPVDDDPGAPSDLVTVRERLAEPILFDLAVGTSEVKLTVPHRNQERRVVLHPNRARVAARVEASGALHLSPLHVDFAPIDERDARHFPEGLNIADVKARLTFHPLETVWMEEGKGLVRFEGAADLRVDWTLVAEDRAFDARPVHAPDMPVAGVIWMSSDGDLLLDLEARDEGALLDWGGLLILSDLALELRLAERVIEPQTLGPCVRVAPPVDSLEQRLLR